MPPSCPRLFQALRTRDPLAVRLRPRDLSGLASSRKLRSGLPTLGIANGVSAVVAVLDRARFSQARQLTEISQLVTILAGLPAKEKLLHFDGHPSEMHIHIVNTQAATSVDDPLGAQASPENPAQADVSRPSDALTV